MRSPQSNYSRVSPCGDGQPEPGSVASSALLATDALGILCCTATDEGQRSVQPTKRERPSDALVANGIAAEERVGDLRYAWWRSQEPEVMRGAFDDDGVRLLELRAHTRRIGLRRPAVEGSRHQQYGNVRAEGRTKRVAQVGYTERL